MTALGFSINMLTLFGMVLAIGIVVDDAIVVIETVEHNMAKLGLSPKDAAKKAMDEVGGALVAIVLVLCAVFVPVAFVPGITGQLYKQFAITIAISVVISGRRRADAVARARGAAAEARPRREERLLQVVRATFTRMTAGYVARRCVIKRWASPWCSSRDARQLSCWLMKTIPTSFLPPEDQGYLLGAVIMPDAASLDRTGEVSRQPTHFSSNPAGERGGETATACSTARPRATPACSSSGSRISQERKSPPHPERARRHHRCVQEALAGARGHHRADQPAVDPGLGTTGGMEI